MDRKLARYKRYTFFLLLVTAFSLVVCAAAFSFKRDAAAAQPTVTNHYTPNRAASQETPGLAGPPASSTADMPANAQGAAPSPSPQEERYTVSVYNGKIGVFRGNEPIPFLTAETEVYLLPQEDILLLRRGIPASSMSQVRAILEDYN